MSMRALRFWCALLLAGAVWLAPAAPPRAGENQPAPAPAAAVDIAGAALKLARVQEPELDLDAARKALDELTARAREALGDAAEPAERVARLNKVLFADRSVSYLSNEHWRDSSLAAALVRRKGNCLSTATLCVIVGRKLDLPIRGVLVPQHALARYDDGRTRINIETTAGGREASDEYYRTRHAWPEADGRLLGYGRSLTDAEFLAALQANATIHLLRANRGEDALAAIDEARRLWPGNPSLELARLGVLREGLGRGEEALRGFARLADGCASPEVRAGALLAVGRELGAQRKHAEALVVLRQAFAVAPKYAQRGVLSATADAYRALRRFDEALVAQELAAAIETDADELTGLAIFYKNAGKLDDAVRCLRRSLEMNPENWNTRLILAGYLIRAGKEDEGWAAFKEVKKPRTDEAFYHTNLAWFYGSAGRKAEFLENLGKALELSKTPQILRYIETEVDFDRYRQDADFKALIEKHRARLQGAPARE